MWKSLTTLSQDHTLFLGTPATSGWPQVCFCWEQQKSWMFWPQLFDTGSRHAPQTPISATCPRHSPPPRTPQWPTSGRPKLSHVHPQEAHNRSGIVVGLVPGGLRGCGSGSLAPASHLGRGRHGVRSSGTLAQSCQHEHSQRLWSGGAHAVLACDSAWRRKRCFLKT